MEVRRLISAINTVCTSRQARIRTVGFGHVTRNLARNEPVCSWALEKYTAHDASIMPYSRQDPRLPLTTDTENRNCRRSLVDVPVIFSGSQVEGPPTFLGVERIHAPPTASAAVDTILDIFGKTSRVLRGLGASPLTSSREPKRPFCGCPYISILASPFAR